MISAEKHCDINGTEDAVDYLMSVLVLSLRSIGGVSIQDPFSEGSDPAFHNKRGPGPGPGPAPGPGGAPYQQGGGLTEPSMRMQYEVNKDPYGGARKGEAGGAKAKHFFPPKSNKQKKSSQKP